MRNAFNKTLSFLAENDPRIVFLTADLGFQIFDEFKERFGNRYVNVGVAEAQMINAAAGLALEGYKPIVYSIASFLLRRSYEQIKLSIGYHELPVVIIGAGGGFTYSVNGPSHHCPDDLSLMSLIPGMTVVAPGSPQELEDILCQVLNNKNPTYIRIGKFGEINYNAVDKVQLSKMRCIRKGSNTAFLTTGDTVSLVIQLFEKLKEFKIEPTLFQIHTIKPIDLEEFKRKFKDIETVIIVEECTSMGGLSSFVKECIDLCNLTIKLFRFGPSDNLALGNPSKNELRKRYGYDLNQLIDFSNKFFNIKMKN